MAEEQKEPQGEAAQVQQVTTKEPQQVTQVTKEPQRVTTKNPKKVEAGKRLAVHNRRRREEQRKEQVKLEKTTSGVSQYYRMGLLRDPGPAGPIGAVIALGVIGGLGYHIYQTKKGEQPSSNLQQNNPKPHPQAQPQTNKFEMD